MQETLSFHEVVRKRHSVRAFLEQPVPQPLIEAVLEDARWSPSNCNTQPWDVHIVSGARRDELSAAMWAAFEADKFSRDFTFDRTQYPGAFLERGNAQAAEYFDALGIARENHGDRRMTMRRNLDFFGAPHAALLFMPSVGDDVRVAGDIGMYGQTFLLSLAAHGLGGIPQTSLGFFADVAREVLGVPGDMKLLFGIAFGYVDEASPIEKYRIGRAPLAETVRFHT